MHFRASRLFRRRSSGVFVPIVLLGAALCSGCGAPSSQQAITRVIAEDLLAQQRVFSEITLFDKYWDGSALLGRYTAALRSIDLSACPADFQQAYLAYIQAWEALQLHTVNNSGMNGVIKGFFAPDAVGGALTGNERSLSRIQEAWFEVERVAQRYGVSVTKIEQAVEAAAESN